MEQKNRTITAYQKGQIFMPENYESNPTAAEVMRTKREADIVMKQCCGLFMSNQVKRTLQEVERRTYQRRGHSERILDLLSAFNYGYILGKRAERARRKAAKT